MSSDIKPGDLVMVVRPNLCCGSIAAVGAIGVVEETPTWVVFARCDACGEVDYETDKYCNIEGGGYHRATLKKIDPIEEDEGVKTVANVGAS